MIVENTEGMKGVKSSASVTQQSSATEVRSEGNISNASSASSLHISEVSQLPLNASVVSCYTVTEAVPGIGEKITSYDEAGATRTEMKHVITKEERPASASTVTQIASTSGGVAGCDESKYTVNTPGEEVAGWLIEKTSSSQQRSSANSKSSSSSYAIEIVDGKERIVDEKHHESSDSQSNSCADHLSSKIGSDVKPELHVTRKASESSTTYDSAVRPKPSTKSCDYSKEIHRIGESESSTTSVQHSSASKPITNANASELTQCHQEQLSANNNDKIKNKGSSVTAKTKTVTSDDGKTKTVTTTTTHYDSKGNVTKVVTNVEKFTADCDGVYQSESINISKDSSISVNSQIIRADSAHVSTCQRQDLADTLQIDSKGNPERLMNDSGDIANSNSEVRETVKSRETLHRESGARRNSQSAETVDRHGNESANTVVTKESRIQRVDQKGFTAPVDAMQPIDKKSARRLSPLTMPTAADTENPNTSTVESDEAEEDYPEARSTPVGEATNRGTNASTTAYLDDEFSTERFHGTQQTSVEKTCFVSEQFSDDASAGNRWPSLAEAPKDSAKPVLEERGNAILESHPNTKVNTKDAKTAPNGRLLANNSNVADARVDRTTNAMEVIERRSNVESVVDETVEVKGVRVVQSIGDIKDITKVRNVTQGGDFDRPERGDGPEDNLRRPGDFDRPSPYQPAQVKPEDNLQGDFERPTTSTQVGPVERMIPIKREDNLKPQAVFGSPEKPGFRPSEGPKQMKPESDFQRPSPLEARSTERRIPIKHEDDLKPEADFQRPSTTEARSTERRIPIKHEDDLKPEGDFQRPSTTEARSTERRILIKHEDNLKAESDFERLTSTQVGPVERRIPIKPEDNLKPEGAFEKPGFRPSERPKQMKPEENLKPEGDFQRPSAERRIPIKHDDNLKTENGSLIVSRKDDYKGVKDVKVVVTKREEGQFRDVRLRDDYRLVNENKADHIVREDHLKMKGESERSVKSECRNEERATPTKPKDNLRQEKSETVKQLRPEFTGLPKDKEDVKGAGMFTDKTVTQTHCKVVKGERATMTKREDSLTVGNGTVERTTTVEETFEEVPRKNSEIINNRRLHVSNNTLGNKASTIQSIHNVDSRSKNVINKSVLIDNVAVNNTDVKNTRVDNVDSQRTTNVVRGTETTPDGVIVETTRITTTRSGKKVIDNGATTKGNAHESIRNIERVNNGHIIGNNEDVSVINRNVVNKHVTTNLSDRCAENMERKHRRSTEANNKFTKTEGFSSTSSVNNQVPRGKDSSSSVDAANRRDRSHVSGHTAQKFVTSIDEDKGRQWASNGYQKIDGEGNLNFHGQNMQTVEMVSRRSSTSHISLLDSNGTVMTSCPAPLIGSAKTHFKRTEDTKTHNFYMH